MVNAEQDITIATLKAQAFDLSQRLRDYNALNEEYVSLLNKYEMLGRTSFHTRSSQSRQLQSNDMESG